MPPACIPLRPRTPRRCWALSKGINLTNTFDANVSPARTGANVARLAKLGFHHVRIPIEHEMRYPMSRNAPDGRLKRLDETVCAAVSMGLAVIRDMHAHSYAMTPETAPDTPEWLAAAWKKLAGRYAVIRPGLIVSEALNEPTI